MIKRTFQSILLITFVTFCTSWSCGQNGPTQPNVVLTWTQSTTAGITKNCIYRGLASGSYVLPGTCIAAGTTFTDASPVAGTVYWYAVTAQVSGVESAYSTPVQVSIPSSPNPPTNLAAPTVTKNMQPGDNQVGEISAQVKWVHPPQRK